MNKSKTLAYILLLSCFSINILYIIQAANYSLKSNFTVSRKLPFTFFMDVEVTPWYEILFATQSISINSLCLSIVGVDTSGPFFIMAACGYLKSLARRLEQLNIKEAYQSQRNLEQEITSCIIYHQQLLALVSTNISP